MNLSALIQGKRNNDLCHSANANPAKVAKVAAITSDIEPRLAGLATLALATPTTDETDIDLWRWFTLAADQIYRSSPKSADSWERHKEHKRGADALCRAGDIPAARAELEKALTALQSATITQPDLPGGNA